MVFALLQPGVHRRAWCAVNDYCGDKGPVWRCKNCILMEPVMQVPSRGTNLQGTFQSATTPAPARQLDVQVDLRGVDWLHFKGDRIAPTCTVNSDCALDSIGFASCISASAVVTGMALQSGTVSLSIGQCMQTWTLTFTI